MKPVPSVVDECAWQAQEQALRAAPAQPDAAALADRRLARALREPPLSPIPFDFAAEVARQALPARAAAPAEAGFERVLGTGLGAVLVLAAVIVGLGQAGEWLRIALEHVPPLPSGTLRLGVALAACVGFSWLIGLLPRWQMRAPRRR